MGRTKNKENKREQGRMDRNEKEVEERNMDRWNLLWMHFLPLSSLPSDFSPFQLFMASLIEPWKGVLKAKTFKATTRGPSIFYHVPPFFGVPKFSLQRSHTSLLTFFSDISWGFCERGWKHSYSYVFWTETFSPDWRREAHKTQGTRNLQDSGNTWKLQHLQEPSLRV